MPPRRFPPPWTIDEMNDVCFIVRAAAALVTDIRRATAFLSAGVAITSAPATAQKIARR